MRNLRTLHRGSNATLIALFGCAALIVFVLHKDDPYTQLYAFSTACASISTAYLIADTEFGKAPIAALPQQIRAALAQRNEEQLPPLQLSSSSMILFLLSLGSLPVFLATWLLCEDPNVKLYCFSFGFVHALAAHLTIDTEFGRASIIEPLLQAQQKGDVGTAAPQIGLNT